MKKTILIVLAVLVLAGVVVFTILHGRSSATAVYTAQIGREDLVATVSGTGQIKPKTYVNVGATAFGRITKLYVKEGDHVQAGQLLATLENTSPASAVQAEAAAIASSRTDVNSYAAAENTALANVAQAKADLEQKRLDYERSQQLYNEKLIAKQDFDLKKATYDMASATLQQREASVAQAQAQTASARSHVAQNVATQRGNNFNLSLTESRAPFAGLVTNVPVREGETVVVGIQNAEGSTLMTLADMSVVTAEVKVDETDIVNVRLGQPADVSIDAFPGKVFPGHVTEVGDQALLRTTGVATSQSTTGTEEAKDFKVVVTLDTPTDELRPGLSANAKITTSRQPNTVTVPIQALVQRDATSEAALFRNNGKPLTGTADGAVHRETLTQGVFKVITVKDHKRAEFVPVSTGVTGATDAQVLSGLAPGDVVVTGTYKVLRGLRSGTAVKQDTTPVSQTTASDSGS